MANLGAVVFHGRSGQSYRFQVWPVGTRFKPLAAVCLFSRRRFVNRNFAATASHECLHLGETLDLSTLRYDSKYAAGADCVCVHLLPDAQQRREVARDLDAALGLWNSAFRVELDPGAVFERTPPVADDGLAPEAPALARDPGLRAGGTAGL